MKNILQAVKPSGNSALLPCPFCGNDKLAYIEYQSDFGPRWMVFCPGCCASVDPGYTQDKFTVQRMWNRRTQNNDH